MFLGIVLDPAYCGGPGKKSGVTSGAGADPWQPVSARPEGRGERRGGAVRVAPAARSALALVASSSEDDGRGFGCRGPGREPDYSPP